jgi:hypothetical protein
MLPEPLDQIPPDQEIGSVTADGASSRGSARSGLKQATGLFPVRPSPRKCHDAIADRGAHAVIPPRKNAKPWKPDSAGAIARNEALSASRYLGRKIWRKWRGYHRLSRAEVGPKPRCTA